MWTRWTSDRKSIRLNSSHLVISYAVFCLKNSIPLRSTCGRSVRVSCLTDTSHSPAVRLYDRGGLQISAWRLAARGKRLHIRFFFLWSGRPLLSTFFPCTSHLH